MTYDEIITKVALEANLSKEFVDKVYKGYWYSIKSMIQGLPLKEELSKEAFSELKTNFNIPSLGKLNCTYDRMLKIKNRFKYIKKVKNAKH